MAFQTYQEKVINKFMLLSEQYHKLSLLMYELSQSLKIKAREKPNVKEFKLYLKSLNIDIDKLMKITKSEIMLKDLKGDLKQNE